MIVIQELPTCGIGRQCSPESCDFLGPEVDSPCFSQYGDHSLVSIEMQARRDVMVFFSLKLLAVNMAKKNL